MAALQDPSGDWYRDLVAAPRLQQARKCRADQAWSSPRIGKAPSRHLKDAAHRIKRRGCAPRLGLRGRRSGRETPLGEVTAPEATIVVARPPGQLEGAGRRILQELEIARVTQIRRRPDLVIAPEFEPISGAHQRVSERVARPLQGGASTPRRALTDALGWLIVLSGSGRSASVPAGRHILSFANNPDWHDDVSDGAVDAELRFPDGTSVPVVRAAWVVVAPPDFAPGVLGLATLYDIALDAAVTGLGAGASPSVLHA